MITFDITTSTTALEEANNLAKSLTNPKARQEFQNGFISGLLSDLNSYPAQRSKDGNSYVLFKSSDIEREGKRLLFCSMLAGCTPEEFTELPVGTSIPRIGGNIKASNGESLGEDEVKTYEQILDWKENMSEVAYNNN